MGWYWSSKRIHVGQAKQLSFLVCRVFFCTIIYNLFIACQPFQTRPPYFRLLYSPFFHLLLSLYLDIVAYSRQPSKYIIHYTRPASHSCASCAPIEEKGRTRRKKKKCNCGANCGLARDCVDFRAVWVRT